MDVAVANEAKRLLDRSGITHSLKLVSVTARDASIYTLTVSVVDGTYEIIVDDASMPEELGPLIDLLLLHAKPAK